MQKNKQQIQNRQVQSKNEILNDESSKIVGLKKQILEQRLLEKPQNRNKHTHHPNANQGYPQQPQNPNSEEFEDVHDTVLNSLEDQITPMESDSDIQLKAHRTNSIGTGNLVGTLRSKSTIQNPQSTENGGNFNLFSHHEALKNDGKLDYSYNALKQAVLELYLSVKIRSDEEIENYNEDFFNLEKEQMNEVDGFTLVDYIKSSIEILMNMRDEDADEDVNDITKGQQTLNDNQKDSLSDLELLENDDLLAQFPQKNRPAIVPKDHDNKNQQKPKKKHNEKEKRAPQEQNDILGTPSSSVLELQQKLQRVMSPEQSSHDDDCQSETPHHEDDYVDGGDEGGASEAETCQSIPPAHVEYEKILQQLEAECRNHIKCEQQMKLHIECMQEKIQAFTDQGEKLRKADINLTEQKKEIDRLNKLVQQLDQKLKTYDKMIKTKDQEYEQLVVQKQLVDKKMKDQLAIIQSLQAQKEEQLQAAMMAKSWHKKRPAADPQISQQHFTQDSNYNQQSQQQPDQKSTLLMADLSVSHKKQHSMAQSVSNLARKSDMNKKKKQSSTTGSGLTSFSTNQNSNINLASCKEDNFLIDSMHVSVPNHQHVKSTSTVNEPKRKKSQSHQSVQHRSNASSSAAAAICSLQNALNSGQSRIVQTGGRKPAINQHSTQSSQGAANPYTTQQSKANNISQEELFKIVNSSNKSFKKQQHFQSVTNLQAAYKVTMPANQSAKSIANKVQNNSSDSNIHQLVADDTFKSSKKMHSYRVPQSKKTRSNTTSMVSSLKDKNTKMNPSHVQSCQYFETNKQESVNSKMQIDSNSRHQKSVSSSSAVIKNNVINHTKQSVLAAANLNIDDESKQRNKHSNVLEQTENTVASRGANQHLSATADSKATTNKRPLQSACSIRDHQKSQSQIPSVIQQQQQQQYRHVRNRTDMPNPSMHQSQSVNQIKHNVIADKKQVASNSNTRKQRSTSTSMNNVNQQLAIAQQYSSAGAVQQQQPVGKLFNNITNPVQLLQMHQQQQAQFNSHVRTKNSAIMKQQQR